VLSVRFLLILKIAELRAAGELLYNSGVGGPRAEAKFIDGMYSRFGVAPKMTLQWLDVVANRSSEAKGLLASIEEPTTDDFYRELEVQFLVTQNLSGACPGCGANVGEVCGTQSCMEITGLAEAPGDLRRRLQWS